MIYHQFQQTPFQSRFSGSKGWLAFAIGLIVMTLVLLALPFVILIGALSFITLSLFGRLFLKRQLAKFRQQTQGFYGFEPQAEQASAETSSRFNDKGPFAGNTPRQGRTFEHNPNE
ncbi:hypothetical protein [Shewanella psychrotolerans]|uniref:hypothetical protein n=1 Tax=Shewanella psychrotolerans TaxID=2864206 RepID=UPI001C65D2F0|nr:hypothetical protein [Shewanella psychrotolerans]QYK01215.1 hypothetical protein K0I62_17910 [Shewanella psychrotolerans]